MRDYMRINRLGLLGVLVAALLSWWAQGYTMTVQVEGASALPVQVSKEMEVPVAMVQESEDKSAPIPIRDELSFSDIAPIQESNDVGAAIPVQDELSFSNVGPIQESIDKGAHIPVQNELSFSDVAPIQESKDKGTPLPVQDELSLLDFTPVQENKYKVAPVTIQWPKTPRRMGPHASDQRHPHHPEKYHPPPSAPAPHPHHQEKDHPPPSAPAPYPYHQEKDNPPRTAPAPTPASPGNGSTDPTQSKSWHKEVAIKALKICGNVLSTSPLPLPFVIYWTTGYLDSTIRFYSKMSLGSTALSSYAWLIYSILQISYKDKEQIVGVDAIMVNGITWGVLAFMFMFLVMHEGLTTRGKRCVVGLVIHSLLTIVLIQFPILRWVKSNSLGEKMVGGIAAALQVFSEIIPLFLLWQTWGQVYPLLGHRNGPAIRNYKKMTIVARAIDGFITLYWMQFCISTYSFDAFGIANVVSAALSVISFVAYSAWALKPSQ